MMGPKEILECILSKEGITYAQLSKDMGLSRPQSLHLHNSLGNLLIVKAIFVTTRKNTRKRHFFIGFLMS